MSKWTRRRILKAGLAASAAAASPVGALRLARQRSANIEESPIVSGSARSLRSGFTQNRSCRERILLDFGWRFHFGHAADPTKDFGYGAPTRELTFAKCGDFPGVCQLEFDDAIWRPIDLPHDWAVELPFKNSAALPEHGGKPLGRDYPETSIGWYRRVFELDKTDA